MRLTAFFAGLIFHRVGGATRQHIRHLQAKQVAQIGLVVCREKARHSDFDTVDHSLEDGKASPLQPSEQFGFSKGAFVIFVSPKSLYMDYLTVSGHCSENIHRLFIWYAINLNNSFTPHLLSVDRRDAAGQASVSVHQSFQGNEVICSQILALKRIKIQVRGDSNLQIFRVGTR